MAFEQYPYVAPKLEELQVQAKKLLDQFESSTTAEQQIKLLLKINQFQGHIENHFTLANVRHSIDTRDKFYDDAVNFLTEIGPSIEEFSQTFKKAYLSSKFRPQLEKRFGKLFFDQLALSVKTFHPSIKEDLVEENKLVLEYDALVASAKIQFDGKELNLAGLGKYQQSLDRTVRKAAGEAYYGFFAERVDKLDALYDQMVKVRTRIAHKLGYKNFVQLAYDRLGRLDYNSTDVANYREQVKEYLVPIAKQLIAQQSKRIGISEMRYYDIPLQFLTGNPTPKGNRQWMEDLAAKMYKELSPVTDEFFQLMQHENLLDLDTKPGKMAGGYMTFIYSHKVPFIFANFNGTKHDVEVLTHEVGHALQGYLCKDMEIKEYMSPTLEACEIHSMSMEFFTYPWMESFFKEDTDKFKYSHIADAITFIPYGVTVDEFQHFVYENPEATPAERRAKWREIEQKYTPYKNYGDNAFLNGGGYWMRQGHIFAAPFYYIDYTLAQVLAMNYFVKSQENYKAAWENYLELCKLGGSLPFKALLQKVGLPSPFQKGFIAAIVPTLQKELATIDTAKL